MHKARFGAAVLLAALVITFSGCNQEQNVPPSGEASSSQNAADIKTGQEFKPAPIDGAKSVLMDFNAAAPSKPGYTIDMPEGAQITRVGGDGWEELYNITIAENVGTMQVSLMSSPADPLGYFSLSDESELKDMLIAYIFPTSDRHDGQLKAVSDFGYTLLTDHYGEREGWKAFYIEFNQDDTATRSVRFLSSNDIIGEEYTGVSVRIDLPDNETAALDSYIRIMNSIRRQEG